jgi:carbonic anhydrase
MKLFRSGALILAGLLVMFPVVRAAEPAHGGHADEVSPAEAFHRLEEDNGRYTHEAGKPKHYAEERHALAKDQHPYAIVLACSDSRVAPEIIFDESLGKLFVVRVAGNVIDPVVLGSIEYAAEHLHTHLVVVLGHEGCGAVKATLDGGTPPPNIAALTTKIQPAVDKTKGQGMDAAVKENVRLQTVNLLAGSPMIREMVKKHEVAISSGVYHLESGEVEWLQKP